jgi:hypothetical protein
LLLQTLEAASFTQAKDALELAELRGHRA